MNNFKWANNHARTSALIYAQAVLEACAKLKIEEPLRVLVDTDDYPAIRKISEVEFAIGWLHGCAECHGVIIEELWERVDARIVCRAVARVRRRSQGQKGRAA